MLPQVAAHLREVFDHLRGEGFRYFKLDFLYAASIPGPDRTEDEAIETYRYGLELIRKAVGEDAILVGCGAPLLPSLGLFDAMCIGPDVTPHGYRSTTSRPIWP